MSNIERVLENFRKRFIKKTYLLKKIAFNTKIVTTRNQNAMFIILSPENEENVK